MKKCIVPRELLPSTCLEFAQENNQVSNVAIPRFIRICLAIEAVKNGYAEGDGLTANQVSRCVLSGTRHQVPGIV